LHLLTAETMRELDRATIEDVGIPGIVLMEAAGRAVADAVGRMPVRSGSRVLVLCGPGNNGGDGFVAARLLADRGHDVTVALLGPADALRGDAATAWRPLAAFPVRRVEVTGAFPDDLVSAPPPDLVIDAIFGTGLARPVEGLFADAIAAVNALPCPRLAVDLPSGVDSDRGRILGLALQADRTVTFGMAKPGHYVHPGAGCCGAVEIAEIGIPLAMREAAGGMLLLDDAVVRDAFPTRDVDANKGRFGHVLVVGGLRGKTGAGVLAATAAMRAGAGLVTLATDVESADLLEGRCPDLMLERAARVGSDHVSVDADVLASAMARKRALIVGPGLSTVAGCDALLDAVLANGAPAVLDADALNLLATRPREARRLGPDRVLTPHPGEAARWLDTTVEAVQQDRLAALEALVRMSAAAVVLKGAGTLVGAPDGRAAVCAAGSPSLATAGTGDVLAGLIGALLARGIPPFDAACAAVQLHARAGETGATRFTEHGMTASDLVALIPETLAGLVAPDGR
jgi:NAD(P)H-hydrate epimerase